MTLLEKIQSMKMPFAELKGVTFVEADKDRVVARMLVRPELCTLRNTIHGGAVMAFADSVGAAGGRQRHHHNREQNQLHRRREGGQHCDRDRYPRSSRAADPGLADTAGDRGRQTGRDRHANPDGALIQQSMPLIWLPVVSKI